ncbi:hypothetical protein FA13DRAFT_1711844 [Coprinellus micaceus]|uniref:Uncharacterized protein n=1 Tax=Coprinellus micaceus TaxID=71717 RepID=A0A4Y7T348_COPMI|nr:hypothetical protein FA13DRAFT_1711844 [Coprinellus micaceus]
MSVTLEVVTGSYDHEIRFCEAWSGICSRTIHTTHGGRGQIYVWRLHEDVPPNGVRSQAVTYLAHPAYLTRWLLSPDASTGEGSGFVLACDHSLWHGNTTHLDRAQNIETFTVQATQMMQTLASAKWTKASNHRPGSQSDHGLGFQAHGTSRTFTSYHLSKHPAIDRPTPSLLGEPAGKNPKPNPKPVARKATAAAGVASSSTPRGSRSHSSNCASHGTRRRVVALIFKTIDEAEIMLN